MAMSNTGKPQSHAPQLACAAHKAAVNLLFQLVLTQSLSVLV